MRAGLTLVVAASFGVACATPARSTTMAQPDSEAAAAVAGEVKKLVQAIDALPDLTRPRVEQLLAVSLKPLADGSGDLRNQGANLEAMLPSGPFARVVLHQPLPENGGEPWMLGLEIRPGVKVALQAFDPDFLGPIVNINPDIPPEGTVARGILGPGRSRVLEFWATSGTLRQASFRRRDQSAGAR